MGINFCFMYTNAFYLNSFEQSKETAQQILAKVDDELFKKKPSPTAWCIAEVLSHINVATGAYLAPMEKKLQQTPNSLPKGSGPYSHPWHFRLLISAVSPESKRKIKTFSIFEPNQIGDLDRATLEEGYVENMDRFCALLNTAVEHELDLGKIKIGNPMVKWVKMSLSACMAVNEAHIRRHLDQIKRLKIAEIE